MYSFGGFLARELEPDTVQGLTLMIFALLITERRYS